MGRTKPRRSRLGRLLVLYRSSREIGVRELASECGVSTATLSRIERGHDMDAGTLMSLWVWLMEPERQAGNGE